MGYEPPTLTDGIAVSGAQIYKVGVRTLPRNRVFCRFVPLEGGKLVSTQPSGIVFNQIRFFDLDHDLSLQRMCAFDMFFRGPFINPQVRTTLMSLDLTRNPPFAASLQELDNVQFDTALPGADVAVFELDSMGMPAQPIMDGEGAADYASFDDCARRQIAMKSRLPFTARE